MMGKFLVFMLLFTLPLDLDKDVQKGLEILVKHKSMVLEIKNTSATEGAEALSIVFPEIVRWSGIKNFFETKMNQQLYVQNGIAGANFSIGYFQMKPSFIEKLEEYISQSPALATFSYVVINEKMPQKARSVRIDRLTQIAWQLRYAHVYWLVAKEKFKYRVFKNPKDRIRFFATAYNYGFFRDECEIEDWQQKKAFPYGSDYKGEQLAYADLAIDFFDKYAQQFEK